MDYMKEAYKEALKSYKTGDIPVGAVIVKDGSIIAKGHNEREKKMCVTKHAEIVAIEKACKVLSNWYLNECEMYVTLEPCMMCTGAIVQSHISKVYFATYSPKYGYLSKLSTDILNYECRYYTLESTELLKKFFQSKR